MVPPDFTTSAHSNVQSGLGGEEGGQWVWEVMSMPNFYHVHVTEEAVLFLSVSKCSCI